MSQATLFTIEAKRELGPVHVYATTSDNRSLCGVKDPLPVVLAEFVPAHIEGWGMTVCPACAEAMA